LLPASAGFIITPAELFIAAIDASATCDAAVSARLTAGFYMSLAARHVNIRRLATFDSGGRHHAASRKMAFCYLLNSASFHSTTPED